MKTTLKRRLRKGFTLVELLVVIIIIAALAGLAYPQVLRAKKKADSTQATSNARQIGTALLEFDNDYSTYPDSSTAQTVVDNTGSTLSFAGNTSNDMFRQLIATGIANGEEIFYAKTPYTKKPDNVFDNNSNALANGEVGFGYLMNGNDAFSTSGNPARPIVVTPLFNAQTNGEFDPTPFDNKAIVLRADNSVQSLNIRPTDKKAILTGSKTLTETGSGTVWGEETTQVTIVAPAKK
jgi:prepilin-type N-terminal cleavage/methylation domain-containing protein